MSHTDQLEHEFDVAKRLAARVEQLKAKQPDYFKHQRAIFEAFDQLEQAFTEHLKQDKAFLESLPAKLQARLDQDKEVLRLRKDVLEMMNAE